MLEAAILASQFNPAASKAGWRGATNRATGSTSVIEGPFDVRMELWPK